MEISIIGCGRWGTFIAWYLSSIGHNVLLYGREHSARMRELLDTRSNGMLVLDDGIRLSTDLGEALTHADTVVVSIGSQALRGMLLELPKGALDGKTTVLCMKGIEQGTGLRLSEVVRECCGSAVRTAIWVGPGHVQEFMKGIPNCMVIDSEDNTSKIELAEAFSSNLIRFYYGDDLLGNEIGAAAKNVIGIAAGILDGKNLTSLKGALMSRGTREVARLIGKMGGNEMTAYGLGHLGDYEATVFSPHSHNRRFGELFVRGEAYKELAEGVFTAKSILTLSERHGVEMPICAAVEKMIYGGGEVDCVLGDLFSRERKYEFV